METYEPQNVDFERQVRDSFARQGVLTLFGASLTRVDPGAVDIVLPFRPELSQQHGFVHAGVVTTIADSACGYAALTLMPVESEVLSVEFKVNMLRRAGEGIFVAEGRVLKAGRILTVTRADVFSRNAGDSTLVATMTATMIRRSTRPSPSGDQSSS